MKKVRNILVALFAIFLMSSCSIMSNLSPMTGDAALGQANFNYVKTVSVSKSSTLILHAIGGRNAAQDAVDELRRDACLQSNQALTNISVVRSDRYGILMTVTTYTITADIVEFTE